MTEQVNRLVGNLLAEGRTLYLPTVGTLYVERRGAKRLSKKLVEPPCRVVEFSSQEQGDSLVAILHALLQQAGLEADAQELYERWLTRSMQEGVLTIEGVGVLKTKHFTPTEAFDLRLNPQGHAPMVMRQHRRFDWTLWLGVVAILVAGGIGYVIYRMMQEQPAVEKVASTTPTTQVEESVATPATDSQTVAPSETPADQPAPQPQPAPATASATPVAPPTAVVEPTAPREEGVTTPVSQRRYVVLGAFGLLENAKRAVTQAVEKDGSFRCCVLKVGNRYLVSPFESEDPEACQLFINAHAHNFRGMWIYTAR